MVFFTEEWFWRGTQSAIFYYVSCTPWVEHKHKRRRRKDAEKSQKEKEKNVIYSQPGVIKQPAPFQTNETWAQEIITGPGPPKGWPKDPLYHKHLSSHKHDTCGARARADTTVSTSSPAKSDSTAVNSSSSTAAHWPIALPHINGSTHPEMVDDDALPEPELHRPALTAFDGAIDGRNSWPRTGRSKEMIPNPGRGIHSPSLHETDTTGSRPSSFGSATSSEQDQALPRPSMEKRLSNAMDGFKDAMRAALHPERWNWIRYERDDEILPSLNEKMKSMWGNVRWNMGPLGEDAAIRLKQIDTKESQNEDDVQRWQRGTHPAVNDLHPPIVSQLPYSREEAKWMLLPPASADVMMGRRRPDHFDTRRRPLCVLGSPARREVPPREIDLTAPSFDDESQESDDDEWAPEWAHVQKPQRAHLRKVRGTSLPQGFHYSSES